MNKLAVKVGVVAVGVMLAGYALGMFGDVQIVKDIKKGFTA